MGSESRPEKRGSGLSTVAPSAAATAAKRATTREKCILTDWVSAKGRGVSQFCVRTRFRRQCVWHALVAAEGKVGMCRRGNGRRGHYCITLFPFVSCASLCGRRCAPPFAFACSPRNSCVSSSSSHSEPCNQWQKPIDRARAKLPTGQECWPAAQLEGAAEHPSTARHGTTCIRSRRRGSPLVLF